MTSASTSDWAAKQYVLFENERTRPVRDLLAAVPATHARVAVDIGCGPGNSTEMLVAHLPGAAVSGIDSSADMIAAARQRLPQCRFELSDVSTWDAPGPYDVILANAVFQWVPDHERLFPSLVNKLAPGGSLAVQMPDNLDEPAHRLMREVAAQGPWADKLKGVERTHAARRRLVLRAAQAAVRAGRRVAHRLPSPACRAARTRWSNGSRAARCGRSSPSSTTRNARPSCSVYRDEIAKAYPALADGTVLLPFPRLFVVATR